MKSNLTYETTEQVLHCFVQDMTADNFCVQESLIIKSINTFGQYKNMDANEERISEFHMMNACTKGQLEIVGEYLKSHNVNDFLYTGWTPLLYAASSAQAEVIQCLIKNGANVNTSKDGYTPLMALCNSSSATTEHRIKCLKMLIDAGANVNASNKQRQSALMYACLSQETEFITELLKYIKNINTSDYRKQTALMYATISNKPNIVKILIENAANVTLTDCNDLSATDIASMKGYDNILSLLNINEEETINVCETATKCDWSDMFPSLTNTNKQTIDFDILTILYGMNLEIYCHIFQGMDLKTFLKLNEHDLCSLGMNINVHREQFMQQLHKFHRKKWSVRSIGVIDKSLPYTLYDGIVSLGTVAKQVSVISSSFRYIKNGLLNANSEKIFLTSEQIENYEKEIKQTQQALGILKKELIRVEALSKVIRKENDIGTPATYIGPKKRSVSWTLFLSITLIVAISVSKTTCIQKLVHY